MKIIILGTAYPYRGGLSAFNERLAREFQAQGHDVQIVTFTMQYPNFLFPGKTQFSEDPAPADLKITRMMNSIEPVSWIRTARYIRKQAPDLLVIKFWIPLMAPCLGSISRMVKRNGKTRVVSVLDNVIPHEKRPFDRLLVGYFMRSVDRFVAMSKSVLHDAELFDNKHPKILCPHPLYDNFGRPTTREDALSRLGLADNWRYLLFFGFIRDYKGLDLFMQALADKRFEKLPVKALVAGEFYNNSEKYMQLEQELKLKDKIVWHTHFISDTQVADYFSACDIVVQPYHSATQSGVTQIAYHFEKPMLVTNVGGLSEIVPNGKVGYVTQVNVQSIADALYDFCTNHKPDDFKHGLQEEKKKYTWKRMIDAIIG